MNIWWELFIENLFNLDIVLLVLIIFYFILRVVYSIFIKIVWRKGSEGVVSKLIVCIFLVVVVLLGLFFVLGVLNLGKILIVLILVVGVLGFVIGLVL